MAEKKTVFIQCKDVNGGKPFEKNKEEALALVKRNKILEKKNPVYRDYWKIVPAPNDTKRTKLTGDSKEPTAK